MDKALVLMERVKELENTSQKIRDFLLSILDERSFVETNAFLFGKEETYLENQSKGEGVVTGYGTIDSMPVYVYAQNLEVIGGGLGQVGASKILKLLETAEKTSTPVLAIVDSNGARMGEGVTALSGYGKIMQKTTNLSGVVPQIAVVKGKAVGQMSYLLAMQDFTFMLEGSTVSTHSGEVLVAKAGLTKKPADVLGAKFHEKTTGINAKTLKPAEVRSEIATLLDLVLCQKEKDYSDISANDKIKGAKTGRDILAQIADDGKSYEVYAGYQSDLFTTFARMGGQTIGFVGTEKAFLNGAMAKKASRFMRFCELYSIPVVTLCDCLGTKVELSAESTRDSFEIANLLYTVADITNAKIAVITKNAVGVGFTAFASKEMGYDFTIALENAFISALPADTGAEIVYGTEINGAKNPAKARENIQKKYAEIEGDPFNSAKDGEIDNIIDSAFLRAYLLQTLSTLEYKESLSQGVGNTPI